MCLISFRAHSHQRVTNLASRAITKERSKRLQRDKNYKLPIHSRTPGSHCCSGSNLGSSRVTDCPAVVQTRIETQTELHSIIQDLRCVIALCETKTTTRGGTSPGFAHNTKKCLHLHWVFRSEWCPHHLPNERAQRLHLIQVTVVHTSGPGRTHRSLARE